MDVNIVHLLAVSINGVRTRDGQETQRRRKKSSSYMAFIAIILLLNMLYSSVHLPKGNLRFFLSFVRLLDFVESSVFLERISRIKSKNTFK